MKQLLIVLMVSALTSGCSSLSGGVSQGILAKVMPSAPVVEIAQTLEVGHNFKDLEPAQRLINNKLDLAAWVLSNESVAIDVAAAAEGIDFSTHKLIYVAAGMKPHAGYTLGFSKGGFKSLAGAVSLKLRLEQPSPSAFYSPRVASPYILLKVPAEDYRRVSVKYEACEQVQTILVSR